MNQISTVAQGWVVPSFQISTMVAQSTEVVIYAKSGAFDRESIGGSSFA